jgi:hypothetical protein
MLKRYVLLAVAVVCIAVPAVGLYASSRWSASTVPSSDVAVAGQREVTVSELNRLIAMRVHAAKVAGQQVPKAGSSAYQKEVVTPAVQQLVQKAQVQNIADEIGVSVTDKDVQVALDQAVTSAFGGSKAKFQAYLKRYGLTKAEVQDTLIRPQLLAQRVGQKLQPATPTRAAIAAYYKAHRSQFATPSQRQVSFILTGSAADAAKARAAVAGGGDWTKTAKQYAISPGPPSTGGSLTASKGQVEQNFNRVVFGSLRTGSLAAPVKVSAAYEQSSLAGKCHPDCYFLIRPTSAIKPGGTQSLSQASAQIAQTLAAQPNQKLVKLVSEQRKATRYNAAYAAAAKTQASSTAPTS